MRVLINVEKLAASGELLELESAENLVHLVQSGARKDRDSAVREIFDIVRNYLHSASRSLYRVRKTEEDATRKVLLGAEDPEGLKAEIAGWNAGVRAECLEAIRRAVGPEADLRTMESGDFRPSQEDALYLSTCAAAAAGRWQPQAGRAWMDDSVFRPLLTAEVERQAAEHPDWFAILDMTMAQD